MKAKSAESSSNSAKTPASLSGLRIEKMRLQIDAIDDELARLLLLRLEIASAVGQLKHKMDLPVRDKERELVVLERIQQLGSHSELCQDLLFLYQLILERSCQIQGRESD